jgi:NADH-quinone oxidoreductase subunit H
MQEFLQSILTTQFLVSALVLFIAVHSILGLAGFSTYLERKISAYIQDRIGPNRTGFDFGLPFLAFLKGFLGIGQMLADGIKFFLKEDYAPKNVDKVLFTLAPVMAAIPALIGFVIIPWGGYIELPDAQDSILGNFLFNLPVLGDVFEYFFGHLQGGVFAVAGASVSIGIIYFLAVASVGVYGITIGGWASNNKYSMIGGLRATAQMISYEIPLGLSLLCALLIAGSFIPNEIIQYQTEHGWLILSLPLPALLFYICALAEANRTPFDNPEAEQELVAGFHTEYSSMRFALFPLAEYAHLITGCAFFALIFLGGYQIPGIAWTSPESVGFIPMLVKINVFAIKIIALVVFAMLIRWTIPRVRYDQVMTLGWQSMIPAGMLMLIVTSVMVYMGWTGMFQLFASSVIMFFVLIFGRKVLAKRFGSATANHRVPLYGSRFSPVAGERVFHHPTNPLAREDRPVQGTVETT